MVVFGFGCWIRCCDCCCCCCCYLFGCYANMQRASYNGVAHHNELNIDDHQQQFPGACSIVKKWLEKNTSHQGKVESQTRKKC